MKVRLVSDGNPSSVVVTDEEGRTIAGVRSLVYSASFDTLPVLQMEICLIPLDVYATGQLLGVHPAEGGELKPIRRIEFADGTAWEDAG